jgi:type IV secretion system protein VirB4
LVKTAEAPRLWAFELGLSEVALAFVAASDKSSQNAITRILAEVGHEGFADAWLRHKGLAWTADMIAGSKSETES